MLVSHLMTPSPFTAAPRDRPKDALALMLQHDIHALPVLEGDRLVGIVSRRDLQVAIGPGAMVLEGGLPEAAPAARTVGAIMSSDVATVPLEETVGNACRLLVGLRVGAVPVVDRTGKLRGILSVTDILAVAAELFERQR